MWKPRRLVSALGVGVGAAFAALMLPLAAAHATDEGAGTPGLEGPYETCDGSVCLVMGDLTRQSLADDWVYSGIRPYLTDWKGDQAYNVTSDGEDMGSYNIKVEDFWNSFFSTSAYQFGDYTPAADAPEDADLGWFGDLSGSSMYKVSMLDGAFTNLTLNNVGPHDASYWVMSTPDSSYTVVSADGASAGYLQIGDSDPIFLWNSLFHSGFTENEVPDYLIPNDPFASLDFDPNDYFNGLMASV